MPNIFQEQITAEKPKSLAEERVYVYVPRATADTPGIASFDSAYFRLNAGKVYLRETNPTQRPSMIMIKDKVEGLETYTEDGHYYIRTYLKSINGDSLAGNTDLKLVTLDTVQTLSGTSLGSGVALKQIELSDSNDEAYGLQVTKYGSTKNVSIGSDRVEIYDGSLQRMTLSYGTIKLTDGLNDYILTVPTKTDTIAVQSDIDRIDTALDTKVDKQVISNVLFGRYSQINNTGTSASLFVNQNTDPFNSNIKNEARVAVSSSDTRMYYRKTRRDTDKYVESKLQLDNSALVFTFTDQVNNRTKELRINGSGVYIDGVIIPKVMTSKAASTTNTYTATYINNLESSLTNAINIINTKIPSEATSANKLADKAFVNSSINNAAAYYITYNAAGDAFPSHAALEAATTFYSGGQVRVPTRNDYCIVRDDEDNDDATTRYSYQNNQWEFQYVVNESPMTADQLAAINSGITSALVTQIGTNQNNIALLQTGKQDTLTAGSNITIDTNNVISATDTTYSAGPGLSLSGTTFGVDTNVIQTKLTFDSTPTENSTNPVTSGGVYEYMPAAMSTADIDAIMDAILM